MTRSSLCRFGWLPALAACSFLTKPEHSEIKCRIDVDWSASVEDRGPVVDPCPDGLYCNTDGVCKDQPACSEKETEKCGDHIDNDCDDHIDESDDNVRELCNGIDDNCDGTVDEGYDGDKDGFTACGDGSFQPGTFDCDPQKSQVHPTAPEECDGLDNNCDGRTDEGASICPAGQVCVGRCVKDSCALPGSRIKCAATEKCIDETCVAQNCSPACAPNEVCDQQKLTCMPIPKRANGEACSVDSDCLSERCIDAASLKLETPTRHAVCGKACCNDAACGPEESCFVSGTGARSCLPKTMNMDTPKPCSISMDCSANQACGLGTTMTNAGTRLYATVCRTAQDRKYAESCGGNLQCSSRMCVAGNYFQQLCTTPCRVPKDCDDLKAATATSIFPALPAYCQYVDLGDYNPEARGSYAPICLVSRGVDVGSGLTGAECSTNRDCVDGACIARSSEGRGRCAQTCCDDSQCTAVKSSMRCLPVARGTGRYEMRCIE